jgi:ubiquinone/menaquinone biosynthesis C-methylase UbiE
MTKPPPPLLFRLVPRWLRDRLRRSIREHAQTLMSMALEAADEQTPADPRLSRALENRVAQLAAIDGKHLPIDPGKDAYMVPLVECTDPASPDGMPIPPENLWWGYADTAEKYLDIGRNNIDTMRSILRTKDGGGDIKPGDRIMDFGCAAGPQIRRLKDFAEKGEVWGVDISAPHVTWCATHLPTCFRFATSTSSPHLPFEDRHFDLIYCGSVFSHLSEMTDAWLLELGRVLRPGGRLYLTINTKKSMHHYVNFWPQVEFSRMVRKAFTDDKPWRENFGMAVVGRSVWQHSVFYLSFFERKCVQANLRVMSVTRDAYSFQDAVLLERQETRRPEPAADLRALEIEVVHRANHTAGSAGATR